MKIIIDSMLRFRLDEVPKFIFDDLVEKLTLTNPFFLKFKKLKMEYKDLGDCIQFYSKKYGKQLRINKYVKFYYIKNNVIAVPRGILEYVKDLAEKNNTPLEIVDNTISSPIEVVPFKNLVALRDYQSIAHAGILFNRQGLICMPCGSGKTTLAICAMKDIGQRTLIITNTKNLRDQWFSEIGKILCARTMILKSKNLDKIHEYDFVVATVQVTSRMSPEQLFNLGNNFGLVIVDEAHHTPAKIFRRLMNYMKAARRFGLTATPYREDGLEDLLRFSIGETIYDANVKNLEKDGYVAIPEVRYVNTEFEFDYKDAKDYKLCIDKMIGDEKRNRRIVEIAKKEANSGRNVVVISSRVPHCQALFLMINSSVSTGILTGKTRDRELVIDDFKAGKTKILVASTVMDEGLDFPAADVLILALPGKSKVKLVQRIGRIMRPSEGKRPIVYDLVDEKVSVLKWQFLSRRRTFRKVFGT